MGKSNPTDKSFVTSKQLVWEAYKEVKANKGAPGVDEVSIEAFESDLKNNLYKIWNRMSSRPAVASRPSPRAERPPIRALSTGRPEAEIAADRQPLDRDFQGSDSREVDPNP